MLNKYQQIWVKAYQAGRLELHCTDQTQAIKIRRALYYSVEKLRNKTPFNLSGEQLELLKAIENCKIVLSGSTLTVKTCEKRAARKDNDRPILDALGLLPQEAVEITDIDLDAVLAGLNLTNERN